MPEESIDHINFEDLNKKELSKPLVDHMYTADPSAHIFNGKGATSTKEVAYVRTNADTEQPKSHKAWHDWLKKYFPNSL